MYYCTILYHDGQTGFDGKEYSFTVLELGGVSTTTGMIQWRFTPVVLTPLILLYYTFYLSFRY
jgi:hypothetical protein